MGKLFKGEWSRRKLLKKLKLEFEDENFVNLPDVRIRKLIVSLESTEIHSSSPLLNFLQALKLKSPYDDARNDNTKKNKNWMNKTS